MCGTSVPVARSLGPLYSSLVRSKARRPGEGPLEPPGVCRASPASLGFVRGGLNLPIMKALLAADRGTGILLTCPVCLSVYTAPVSPLR